ncbi:MAG: hypothetical protein ACREJ3_11830 [Polyangiaceae bacterium]
MSKIKKPTMDEIFDAIEDEDADREAARILGLSDEDLDRELAEVGFDPAALRERGREIGERMKRGLAPFEVMTPRTKVGTSGALGASSGQRGRSVRWFALAGALAAGGVIALRATVFAPEIAVGGSRTTRPVAPDAGARIDGGDHAPGPGDQRARKPSAPP